MEGESATRVMNMMKWFSTGSFEAYLPGSFASSKPPWTWLIAHSCPRLLIFSYYWQKIHPKMDAFQVRMEFLDLLKRLNASQQSIRKTAAFALRYANKCADNIWDCIMTECSKVGLQTPAYMHRKHQIHGLTCCLCSMLS